VTLVTHSAFNVKWKAPFNDGGESPSKYVLKIDFYKGNPLVFVQEERLERPGDGSVLSYTWQSPCDDPKPAGKEAFRFSIAGKNSAGEGVWSDPSPMMRCVQEASAYIVITFKIAFAANFPMFQEKKVTVVEELAQLSGTHVENIYVESTEAGSLIVAFRIEVHSGSGGLDYLANQALKGLGELREDIVERETLVGGVRALAMTPPVSSSISIVPFSKETEEHWTKNKAVLN